ncbi:MAG: hypothetical protein WCO93_06450 [bacterium]
MNKALIPLFFCVLILFSACSKSNNNPSNNTLTFSGLTPQDTTMKVNGIISITANATGEELTYHWTATYGTFIGKGPTVQWTVCHSDRFEITCEVRDKYDNVESRQVYINVHN